MLMLMLLYFTDYKGSLLASGSFALVSTLASIISLRFPPVYAGVGFILGGSLFFLTALIRLNYYTKRLPYFILSAQPIAFREKNGAFTRLGRWLNRKLEGGRNAF